MITTFRVTFLSTLVLLFILYVNVGGRIDPLYSGTHFLIIALALLHIMRVRRFNLGLSFSFFALFFFGVIPLFEYKLHISYNGMSMPRDSSYLTAAAFALLSSVSFYLGYGLRRGGPAADVLSRVHFLSRRHYQLAAILAAGVSATLALLIGAYYGFDPASLFFRGFAEEQESSAFGYSFITFFVRPLLFNVIFVVALMRARLSGPGPAVYILCLVLIALVSPLGIPRSLAGALYIPFVMLVFFPKLTSKYSTLCAIVFAVLFAAPIFDIFRVIQNDLEPDLVANFNLDYLFAGHFDAFYNFVQVVDLRYSSSGWQTIGALLFWVPRAVWPGKPLGTSFDFADFAGFRSGNVSFPLTADLYADYGAIGVILGMFLLGIAYRRLDRLFERAHEPGSLTSYVAAIAHMELAILGIYLLRGSFLSSLSFTVGVAFTFVIILIANEVLHSFEGSARRARPAATT